MDVDTSTLDVPDFGELPFDHWILQYARGYVSTTDEVPAGVHVDLLTPGERACDGHYSKSFWIRTWFGEKNNEASQRAADDGYKRLYFYALQNLDENADGDEPLLLNKNFAFDHADVETSELHEGNVVARPWSMPSWLVDAFCRYPDQLNSIRILGLDSQSERGDADQNLLVCTADRKACEEGWLLLLGVNHKGQILPARVRERAADADLIMSSWNQDSPMLAECVTGEPGEEEFLHDGDGWEV
ncbi:hypothetical protein ASPCAL04881 [Aspergillus calidoustus]|uniref:Uncharacterized protein n=1 Tax=Aspergillus calidoustus TaxID=454130 RepID=A0A0U5FY96_ASPCI|nr:hypothetical protein ASPCAL04881 [Aspergillus calidoustus]